MIRLDFCLTASAYILLTACSAVPEENAGHPRSDTADAKIGAVRRDSSAVKTLHSLKAMSEAKAAGTIRRIFDNWQTNEEAIETPAEAQRMKAALLRVQTIRDTAILPLLIDVWSYYDPTDFPTQQLVDPTLKGMPDATIRAIQRRLAKRHTWERDSGNSWELDLLSLEKQLKKIQSMERVLRCLPNNSTLPIER